MQCIYCKRVNPPCNFVPIGISGAPVLGESRSGFICHDCDKTLRGPGRDAFLSELSYAMRSASDT